MGADICSSKAIDSRQRLSPDGRAGGRARGPRCERLLALWLRNLAPDLLGCHRKLKSVAVLSHHVRRNNNLCPHQGRLQLSRYGLLSFVHSHLCGFTNLCPVGIIDRQPDDLRLSLSWIRLALLSRCLFYGCL